MFTLAWQMPHMTIFHTGCFCWHSCLKTVGTKGFFLKDMLWKNLHTHTKKPHRERPHRWNQWQQVEKKNFRLSSLSGRWLNQWLRTSGRCVCVCAYIINTHLFCSHGFKHLLQQDPHLLNVVHQHTRLHKRKRNEGERKSSKKKKSKKNTRANVSQANQIANNRDGSYSYSYRSRQR